MKRLLLLRHAKSSWDDASQPDHERPLNKRGLAAAPRMGRLLIDEGLRPDRVLSSTAVRAKTTAEIVLRELESDVPFDVTSDLYHATPRDILDVLAETPEGVVTQLIVGHNPGFEELLALLTGEFEEFPTAALAAIDLPLEDWWELSGPTTTRGELHALWRPKELD